MMRIYLLFLIFLPLLSFADSEITIVFRNRIISQGSLQDVDLVLNQNTLSKLGSIKLAGTTINETLYLSEISPFIKIDDTNYKAEATIIFVKPPTLDSGDIETNQGKVKVKWGPIEVRPTEAPETFLFGTFEISKNPNVLIFFAAFVGLMILLIPIRSFYKSRKSNQAKKKQLKKLKIKIVSANNYEAIVDIWKIKHELLLVFPAIKEPFQKFEKTLFQVQFKPEQNEIERTGVVKAYELFLNEIKGEISGV